MEYVNAILYHKIQDSDFTNMYGVKKPKSGGGQTYIQAAGYDYFQLDNMFNKSDEIFNTSEFWDNEKQHPKRRYTFDACAIGTNEHALIELAPRTGRKDYRISRQNIKHRHPAWQKSNGFPEPKLNPSPSDIPYLYEKNYPGLIDNLYIYIVKTFDDNTELYKYYASYISSHQLPSTWPVGVNLESIFEKENSQGIIFYMDQLVRFHNNKESPFEVGSAIDKEIDYITLPENLSESHHDAIEFSQKNIQFEIDHTQILITKVDAPKPHKKSTKKRVVSLKGVNYEIRNRNLKNIGDIGEELAIEIEKRLLIAEGREDLAHKIQHVSKTIGDGLGYDILSYQKHENTYIEKYIEVKATTGGKNKPFDISSNEVSVSAEKGHQYFIYRFFALSSITTEVQFYEVRGSVEDNFILEPTMYRAYYNQRESD